VLSKQGELIDLIALTDWKKVYAAASVTDQTIVDFVQEHPGVGRREIAEGLDIPAKTLDFRLWELSGRSTAGHRADGLLIAERKGSAPKGDLSPWRYYARER